MAHPISHTLELELLNELRRNGVIVWLDKDNVYGGFVDGLAARYANGEFPFPVLGFRGSFVELLFGLETHGSSLDKHPLLLHMPGFNEESIRKTPLLELYEVGVRFRKGLDTLIREASTSYAPPAEVERFVGTEPSFEEAEAWLEAKISESATGLATMLEGFGPMMLVQALGQEGSPLDERIKTEDAVKALTTYLHDLTGMDEAWIETVPVDRRRTPLRQTLDALAAWVLAVEYVHDLRRPPFLDRLKRLRELSAPIVKACSEITTQLRRQYPERYVQHADEAEHFLAEEIAQMTPEDLGHIDTFREEEIHVRAGAVEALLAGDYAKAKAWCEARQGEQSFWLHRDQAGKWEWMLIGEGAAFGEVLARHPRLFEGARTLEQAASLYASSGFEVDRAHRRFEQQVLALLEPWLPHAGSLQEVGRSLRQRYREWADCLARDFTALCTDRGFLPEPAYQQRTIYEQVVQPLAHSGDKVGVFVIDALRYEMAEELASELTGSGAVVDLKPRLAELPTITSVGMNALAPVATGERLSVAGTLEGFRSGEFTVKAPGDRARAMGVRSFGKPALSYELAEVCEKPAATLSREIKPHQLVVVHSRTIDDAGEANVGLPTFESSLRQIKAAWHKLQQAGVKSFVFTADHGFLLNDETTVAQPFGKKDVPTRRYVLDEYPRREAGMVPVSLSSLGYDGLSGYLLFREDTAIFETRAAGATFVHGGNSPQERIIPVLTITRKRADVASLAAYEVEVENAPAVMKLHRLRLRVIFPKGTTTSLGFAAARSIDLALRALERDDVDVVIRDVVGPSELRAGRLRVSVGEAWTEVFFSLEGPDDGRVRMEVFHPDNVERVRCEPLEPWYSVSGRAASSSGTGPPSSRTPSSWADAIGDEAVRKVFEHIERHSAITETEATRLLGSPRAFRRFSAALDDYFSKLPFRIRTEIAESGKRYVREGRN